MFAEFSLIEITMLAVGVRELGFTCVDSVLFVEQIEMGLDVLVCCSHGFEMCHQRLLQCLGMTGEE